MNTFVLGKVGTGKTAYLIYQLSETNKKHIVIVDGCGEYGKIVSHLESKGYKIWKEEIGKEEDINISLEEKTVFYFSMYPRKYEVPTRLENCLTSLHAANENALVVFDSVSHFDELSKCMEISTMYLSLKGEVYISSQVVSPEITDLLEKRTHSQITTFMLTDKGINKLTEYGMSESEVSLLYRMRRLPQFSYMKLMVENKKITPLMPEGIIKFRPEIAESFGLRVSDNWHYGHFGKTAETKKSEMS